MKYDNESIRKRIEKTKTIKVILYLVLIIIVYNIFVIAVSSINIDENISIFGLKYYIITTSSMAPNINKNDVVVCKKVEQQDLKKGDVITYLVDGNVITHRITQVNTENGETYYIAKGDNNTIEDQVKIKYDDIQGKEVYIIPKIRKNNKCIIRKNHFFNFNIDNIDCVII